MKLKNVFWGAVEAVLWYFFAYQALYAVKNPVDLQRSALIIVALAYAAAVACPIFRNSEGWRRVWGKR